ncbi:MAG: hypothetical protein P8107_05530 [Spirochaetia bacterium]|jgi:hypothetical protein
MPVEFSVNTEKNLVHIKVTGLANTEELLNCFTEVMSHPDFHSGMKTFTDLRQAAHFVKPEDVRKIAGLLTRNIKRIKGGKAAAVVSKEVSFGMARMLQMYTERVPFKIEVFYEADRALQWLET